MSIWPRTGKCSDCLGPLIAEASDARADTEGAVALLDLPLDPLPRWPTGLDPLDLALGGVVEGGVILLGGDPGVGKSSLLLQALGGLGEGLTRGLRGGLRGGLYVSAEQPAADIRRLADRIGAGDEVYYLPTPTLDACESELARHRYRAVGVDSVQRVRASFDAGLSPRAGLVARTEAWVDLAHRLGVAVLLLAHVTRDSEIAGPRTIEHLVDVVCYLEAERDSPLRILRVFKNRFGPTDVLGRMEMTPKGLR